jgi:hypothetical protein
MPVEVRKKIIRYFTIWGWVTKSSKEVISETVDNTRLLTFREFKELFPKCDIIKEKLMGIFTKSYIAYRR